MNLRLKEAAARLRAKGFRAKAARQKKADRGGMTGTEARYRDFLEARRLAGEIAWWDFEAIKFRLADLCWYSPDFLVILPAGEMELHEVKACSSNGKPRFTDDARVKLKIAAEAFWQFRWVGAYELPRAGGWTFEEFSCRQ